MDKNLSSPEALLKGDNNSNFKCYGHMTSALALALIFVSIGALTQDKDFSSQNLEYIPHNLLEIISTFSVTITLS